MKIIDVNSWQVEDHDSKTLILNHNYIGDTVTSELYVNPLSDCEIEVKGFVDESDTVGQVLKCVDIANLSKVDEIEVAGNYCFVVGSYYKVTVEVTGTSVVTLKQVY